MGQTHDEETTGLLIKLGLYIASLGIGIATKMATMYKDSSLTWKQFLYYALVGLSSGISVGIYLYMTGHEMMAIAFGPVIGRYADSIFLFIWLQLKKVIANFSKDITNID